MKKFKNGEFSNFSKDWATKIGLKPDRGTFVEQCYPLTVNRKCTMECWWIDSVIC